MRKVADLPPALSQASVLQLEERCRSQSRQFALLSRELERFRLQTGDPPAAELRPLTNGIAGGPPSLFTSEQHFYQLRLSPLKTWPCGMMHLSFILLDLCSAVCRTARVSALINILLLGRGYPLLHGTAVL